MNATNSLLFGDAYGVFQNYLERSVPSETRLECEVEASGDVIIRAGNRVLSRNSAKDNNREFLEAVVREWNGEVTAIA